MEFFVRGYSYKLLGIAETDIHLFGVRSTAGLAPRINLLGTDQLGRDRFSRLLYAVRFSLIVASIGVLVACLVGIFIGGVSGYAGRLVDTFLMGATDAMLALPTLILILGVRAAFPLELPITRAAFSGTTVSAMVSATARTENSPMIIRRIFPRSKIISVPTLPAGTRL